MWSAVPIMGIGQRWDGGDTQRVERYLGEGLDFIEPNLPVNLSLLPSTAPLVTHSSELALATSGGLNEGMLRALTEQVQRVKPPWTGEHFSLVSREPTGDLGYNAAPILDRIAIEAGVAHVDRLQRAYGCPVALEAGPRYLDVGGWDDHGAILEISRATNCGILLDVSHHLVSMLNLGKASTSGLGGEVLERTVEVHVTGLGRHEDGLHYHDFHGGPVTAEAWALLAWVVQRTPNLKGITLEHDQGVDEAAYASDLRRLRTLAEGTWC